VINHKELGNLSIGSPADIALLSLDKGNFGYLDSQGFRIKGDQKLTCQMTVLNGDVVWDLNGLSGKSLK
jgi:dihydroorotase